MTSAHGRARANSPSDQGPYLAKMTSNIPEGQTYATSCFSAWNLISTRAHTCTLGHNILAILNPSIEIILSDERSLLRHAYRRQGQFWGNAMRCAAVWYIYVYRAENLAAFSDDDP